MSDINTNIPLLPLIETVGSTELAIKALHEQIKAMSIAFDSVIAAYRTVRANYDALRLSLGLPLLPPDEPMQPTVIAVH